MMTEAEPLQRLCFFFRYNQAHPKVGLRLSTKWSRTQLRFLIERDSAEMRTRSLKVIDMAVRNVATISADKTIQECAQQMRADHVGSLVVIDEDRKPVGMITDRDIAIEVVAQKLDPAAKKVADIMTAPVVTATPNEGMVVALARMREFGIRRLPIVDEEGHIVGVISNSNLIEELSELLSSLVRNIHSSKTREVTLRP